MESSVEFQRSELGAEWRLCSASRKARAGIDTRLAHADGIQAVLASGLIETHISRNLQRSKSFMM